jgi:ankyrin repeat protein
LLYAGADVKSLNNKGWTALHFAAVKVAPETMQAGHVQTVGLLLAPGAPINAAIQDIETPLHCAAAAGHVQIVQQLLAAGANVDVENVDGDTALVVAAVNGHVGTVQLLLFAGAAVEAGAGEHRNTVLGMAAQYGCVQVVELLLAAGACVDAVDAEGWTPLQLAAGHGHAQVVQ